jgi:hypothetical protein
MSKAFDSRLRGRADWYIVRTAKRATVARRKQDIKSTDETLGGPYETQVQASNAIAELDDDAYCDDEGYCVVNTPAELERFVRLGGWTDVESFLNEHEVTFEELRGKRFQTCRGTIDIVEE